MAVFDLEEQKIFVRLVYDGTQNVGKTTNLKKLCDVFTTKRRSELVSPEDLGGRTLYFDWVQISTGLANGFPLVCQVITVPGQVALEARRRHLLSTADAVVFVSDSRPETLPRARAALTLLLEERARRETALPIIIQANKQDLPGACPAGSIAEELGLPPDTPAISASAEDANGVLETFVAAVRAMVNEIQERTQVDGFRIAVTPAESAEELYDELARLELAPNWMDEVLGQAATPEVADEPEAPLRGVSNPEAPLVTSPPNPLSLKGEGEQERDPPSGTQVRDHVVPNGVVETPCVVPAPLPTHDVPTGFIWPASTGREIVKHLDRGALSIRNDLVGAHGLSDGSGKSDLILCQAGSWCLKTSERRHFADVEAARAALVRAARAKATLADLIVPETVLVVQPDADGSYWLWTVTPWLTTLRAQMSAATERADEDALATALSTFARLSVDALLLASRSGIILDVHPSNFGELNGRTYYVDDDITNGTSFPAIAYSLLKRVDEYSAWTAATEAYVTAVERQLSARVEHADIDRLALLSLFEQVVAQTNVGVSAKDRLIRCVAQATRARA